MDEHGPSQTTQVSRPLGVWILTIYALIFAGILPLVVEFLLLISEETIDALNSSLFFLISAVAIGFGILITSALTWRGNNYGRLAFLVLITIHYGLIAFNNALLIFAGEQETGLANIGRIFQGVLYPVLYIWYFNRLETKRFFIATSTSQDDR